MVRNYARVGSFDPLYMGPYSIVDKASPMVFAVKMPRRVKWFHINQCKSYKPGAQGSTTGASPVSRDSQPRVRQVTQTGKVACVRGGGTFSRNEVLRFGWDSGEEEPDQLDQGLDPITEEQESEGDDSNILDSGTRKAGVAGGGSPPVGTGRVRPDAARIPSTRGAEQDEEGPGSAAAGGTRAVTRQEPVLSQAVQGAVSKVTLRRSNKEPQPRKFWPEVNHAPRYRSLAFQRRFSPRQAATGCGGSKVGENVVQPQETTRCSLDRD